MALKLTILLLLIAVRIAAGQKHESSSCDSMTITCVCGIGNTKRYVPLDLMRRAEVSATGESKCISISDPYQACANISCFLSSRLGLALQGEKFMANFYPMEFSIPPMEFSIPSGGVPGSHRYTRKTEPCHVTPVKNAVIKCWKWPNWMNCDINCIHGYALEHSEGSVTTKNINCRNTENVWKPHDFQECKPFVNCFVNLVKPGYLNCTEPLNAPAYCDISCLDYDQYEATSLQRYECIDDNFPRTLPHCATLTDDVSLVKKPQ